MLHWASFQKQENKKDSDELISVVWLARTNCLNKSAIDGELTERVSHGDIVSFA